jgi:hypothetical protein
MSIDTPSASPWARAAAKEIARADLRLAAGAALGVERGAQELDVGDAGYLDRVLEAEEQAGGGALVGGEGEEIEPFLLVAPDLIRGRAAFLGRA